MKGRIRVFGLMIFVFLLGTSTSFSQIERPTDKVSWKFSVEQKGEIATIVTTITCVEHWHINAVKLPEGSFGFATGLELKKSAEFSKIGGVIEPKPKEMYDKIADEQLAYHEGTFKIKQKIKVLSEKDFTVKGTFSFQPCDEVKCLPSHFEDFELKIKGFKKDVEEEKAEETNKTELKINGDFAVDKGGNNFVMFKEEWVAVPSENSPKFYKKYLELGGDVK